MMIRLNKWIKDQGYTSRRDADRWILEGKVKVNGILVTELGFKINPAEDILSIQDQDGGIRTQKTIVIALNKPTGYVTTLKRTEHEQHIITDLIKCDERVFPVGRLDKDSQGLLILTNDGDLAQKLTHPSYEHEKEYEVVVTPEIPNGALKKLENGITLFGSKTKNAPITRLSNTSFRIILQEGKNRQIRRMCRKVGHQVLSLTRIRIGSFCLDPSLRTGLWRILSPDEILLLLDHRT